MPEPVQTNDAPQAVGPYSQAVKSGGHVFLSGQIPLDPATGEMVTGDIETQTKRVIQNLEAVLKASGSSIEQVVKVTIFLTSMKDFPRVNEVYGSFFAHKPARATVEVSGLPLGADVEMDAIAEISA